jgi:hypothetical protein
MGVATSNSGVSSSAPLKLRLMNSNVILLYASECWKLNVQLEKHVLAFENMCLKRIPKASWQENITKIAVCRRTGHFLTVII